ncbi:MAG: cyclic lactone autoinducer peptide [Lachnospiraceae bacterium]|nr:cyclic lactone autoinducer peptide [Lachnospiraceae bacterium]
MKKDITKKSAKLVVKALNSVLHTEANSTSCYFAYQPKAPESLSRFRRNK